MGLREFFAMEAGEYLEHLEGLVTASAGPDREEFLRLTRALRGSALMANQRLIGEVAAGLENLARALKDKRVEWGHRIQQAAVGAIGDLGLLISKTGEWGGAEDSKATAIAVELNELAGTPKPSRTSGARRREVDAGTRAFLAREAATVASCLDRLARSYQRDSVTQDQFEAVFRAMQPLRGLAALPDLSPIPEFLDGIDRAIGAVELGTDSPNDVALLFDAAARGLSAAAKEITTSGSARADSTEAQEFAHRLGAILETSGDVVPIQSLFFDDDGPHVVEEGTPSAAPSRLVELELVAHGEHLQQAAEELARAQWDTQRELRALALTSTFRSLVAKAGAPLEDAVAKFAAGAASAVSRRVPINNTDRFVDLLREAGAILSASVKQDSGELARRLSAVTAGLDAIPSGDTDEQVAEASGGPLTRPPAPSASMTAEVDALDAEIPGLPPDELEASERVAELGAPEKAVAQPVPRDTAPGLAASWRRYEEVTEDPGAAALTIDELLADLSGPAEAATPLQLPEIPEVAALEEEPEEEVVPITDLCYQGAEAQARARTVRSQIRETLAAPELDRPLLQDLVEELLDLTELSLEPQT